MDDLGQVLIKSFTRYFIPGLITLVIAVYLPLYFFTDRQIFVDLKLFDVIQVLVFSIVLGYLLDSIGAYGWTLSFRSYKQERQELTNKLKAFLPSTISSDPDQYLAQLWLCNEGVYDRLFVERAEWVMILESSAALLLAGIVFLTIPIIKYIFEGNLNYWESIIAIGFFILSYISSRKGVQRMRAHNMKLIQAIRALVGYSVIPPQKINNHEGKK
jgi:hypothetical protein